MSADLFDQDLELVSELTKSVCVCVCVCVCLFPTRRSHTRTRDVWHTRQSRSPRTIIGIHVLFLPPRISSVDLLVTFRLLLVRNGAREVIKPGLLELDDRFPGCSEFLSVCVCFRNFKNAVCLSILQGTNKYYIRHRGMIVGHQKGFHFRAFWPHSKVQIS